MVVPAIIPQSFDHLSRAIESVATVARSVQVDIVDGAFVPFVSWPYRGSGSVMLLRKFTEHIEIEVDLMIASPEDALSRYGEAGVARAVVHLEGVTDMSRIRALQHQYGFMLGLSILNDSPLELLTRALMPGDYVQLMGIAQIGSQGQPFDDRVLDRIRALHAHDPSLLISIDGSVHAGTLPLLREAGASRFVSGSAIFGQPDPARAYEALAAL